LVEESGDGDEVGHGHVVDCEQIVGGRRRPSTAEDVTGHVTSSTGDDDVLSNSGSMPPKSRSVSLVAFH
jgi:hypothetical protein